jgi:hypothetical protein
MSHFDFSRWTAQSPPDDFADRALCAMLAPAAARRPRRGRFMGGMLLAAILLGASAWGMLATRRAPPPSIEPVSAGLPEIEPPRSEAPAPRRSSPGTLDESIPMPDEPPRAAPSGRRAPERQPPSRRQSREPMCHCEADLAVCGCLE